MGTDLDTLGLCGSCGGGVLRGSRAQWRYVEDSEVPGSKNGRYDCVISI